VVVALTAPFLPGCLPGPPSGLGHRPLMAGRGPVAGALMAPCPAMTALTFMTALRPIAMVTPTLVTARTPRLTGARMRVPGQARMLVPMAAGMGRVRGMWVAGGRISPRPTRR
jgi:hypothetical protein